MVAYLLDHSVRDLGTSVIG